LHVLCVSLKKIVPFSNSKKAKNMNYDEALRWAQDDTAPAEKLWDAFHHFLSTRQLIIGQALASNPNSPPDILVQLTRNCLPEIAQNPALPLLFLENWNLLPQDALLTITSSTFPTLDVLKVLVHHPDPTIAQNVRMHVTFAGEASETWCDEAGSLLAGLRRTLIEGYFLKKFQYEEDTQVPVWIRKHFEAYKTQAPKPKKIRPTPRAMSEPWDTERIAAIKKAKYTNRLKAVQSSQNADFLRIMSEDENKNVRGTVVKNPYTPIEVLYSLSEEEDVQQYLVENPNIPEELLCSILTKTPKLVEHLPLKPHAPTWALELYWQKTERYRSNSLCELLLSRSETSYQIQKEAFFQDNKYDFNRTELLHFIGILQRSNPDHYLLRERAKLAWWGKLAYLLNPNIPEEGILKFVAQDPNRYVRAATRERLWERAG
jgi:hypothetical protein